jgi:predicted  nucleic acid-binding Zn-ribbon protein
MLKSKAAGAQAGLENAKTKVKEIESKRKELELEVESKKELIRKYANQQFQTRKNEEYRALAHEIEGCKEAIFKIENDEIALMEQTEVAQKAVKPKR